MISLIKLCEYLAVECRRQASAIEAEENKTSSLSLQGLTPEQLLYPVRRASLVDLAVCLGRTAAALERTPEAQAIIQVSKGLTVDMAHRKVRRAGAPGGAQVVPKSTEGAKEQ